MVFKLAHYIINLKEQWPWLPSHEILNAVLQRQMLSNVALSYQPTTADLFTEQWPLWLLGSSGTTERVRTQQEIKRLSVNTV